MLTSLLFARYVAILNYTDTECATLFTKLFRYAEIPGRSRLEDFLTEALSEVFERLPPSLKISFAIMFVPITNRPAFEDVLRTAGVVSIKTQVNIPTRNGNKRPDLVIYANTNEVLVIEVKIGAAFQRHGHDDTPSSVSIHQLQTYARWIKAINEGKTWPGAVALLTADTLPPKDFIEGSYEGTISAVRLWRDIERWIVSKIPADATTSYCMLAHELRHFLREKHLVAEYISSRDIAAASLFVGSERRLHATFRETIEAVSQSAQKLKGGSQYHLGFWSASSIYWSYFYFAQSLIKVRKPFVAVGICFELSGPWELYKDLPTGEPFFFIMCSDEFSAKRHSEFLSKIPDGWREFENGMSIGKWKPVSGFPTDPDKRLHELKAWAVEATNALVACIPGYASAPIETPSVEDEAPEN